MPGTPSDHEKHCFIVMPFGRDDEQQIWFKGWYKEVVKPAVVAAGYEPILAVATDAPSLITEEMLGHLAFDPMVVIDLGGMTVADEPNPNVMYELGIRHAFGLPHVLMAWKNQRLPFDISMQRVMTDDRRPLFYSDIRDRLATFIKSAANGLFYKPMDSVGRLAKIQALATAGHDDVMQSIAIELKEIKARIAASDTRRQVDSSDESDAERVRRSLAQVIDLELPDIFLHKLSKGEYASLVEAYHQGKPADFAAILAARGNFSLSDGHAIYDRVGRKLLDMPVRRRGHPTEQ